MNTALILNPRTLQLTGSQGAVDINLHELVLLQAFSNAEEQRLTTEQLLVLTGVCAKRIATLNVKIVRLRKKLVEAGAKGPTIKSIQGIGYQLCLLIELAQPANPKSHSSHQQSAGSTHA
jgi:DNA-binding response OmpR family regulator